MGFLFSDCLKAFQELSDFPPTVQLKILCLTSCGPANCSHITDSSYALIIIIKSLKYQLQYSFIILILLIFYFFQSAVVLLVLLFSFEDVNSVPVEQERNESPQLAGKISFYSQTKSLRFHVIWGAYYSLDDDGKSLLKLKSLKFDSIELSQFYKILAFSV